jgi:ABC-type sugar transport system substrate-binding protein
MAIHRRTKSIIALALGLALSTAACSSSDSGSADKPEKMTIGFVEITEAAPVVLAVQKELKRGIEMLGWEMKTVNANGDPAQMAAGVSAMVNQNVDAVVTLAIQPAAAAQGLAAAKAKGIPTIILGAPAVDPEKLYDVSYAPDDAKLATMVAEQLVKDLGGKGKILQFDASGQPAIEARTKALEAVLAKSDVKAAQKHETDLANGVQDTQSTVSSALRANPAIKAIWASQDFAYAPAVKTVLSQNLGKAGVYSIYLTPEAFPILREGKVPTAVADSPLKDVAWYALDSLVNKLILDKKDWVTPTSVKELPYVLVTPENVPDGDSYPYDDVKPFFQERWANAGVKLK